MSSQRMLQGMVMLVVLGLGGLGLLSPAGANASEDGKIKGIAAGLPPGGITVPLAGGSSPMAFQVTFGSPSITFPVILTPATVVKIEEGTLPATLHNGDAVEVEGILNPDGTLVADELELQDFIELEIDAFIMDIPGGTSLSLPLAPGSAPVTIVFRLATSGTIFSMVITPETQIEEGTLLLHVGDRVEFQSIVRDGQIQVHKFKTETEAEDEAEHEVEHGHGLDG